MLTFETDLMQHQKEAFNKLQNLKVGALYMEMGTGKTLTALKLSIKRLKEDKVDCVLWLCPVSVKQTIANEIEKHLDSCIYELVQPEEIKNWQAHVYIAGIESVSQSDRIMFRLYDLVQNKDCFVIVDESSLIKNYTAKRTQNIWRLGEQSEYKLILNGTPVTNTEEDLFCQWYFLDPRILGYTSYYSFAANHLEFHEEYNYVVRAHNTDLLVNKIAPYTYQIKKDECLGLPKKNYSSRYYNMTWRQKEIYYSAMDEILMDISVEEFTSYTLFQLFTALQKVISGITPENNKIFGNPMNNPRIKALFDIINNLPEEKTIIWCKYQHEINTIKRILSDRFNPGQIAEYWGELSEKEKNRQLDKFKNQAQLLVANKSVGAFGLNLQFCNYAIYYSNDFNWATRKQSEDRIHRAGQENNVHIIDVVCRESIDERIQEVLHQKGSLVNSFKRKIDDMKDKEDLRRWINNAEKVSEKECV